VLERNLVQTLGARMAEPRRFLQLVVGPRQTGKTTAVTQMLEHCPLPQRYASADDAIVPTTDWLRNEWELARMLTTTSGGEAVLVLDEVQKVADWPTAVKSLWDEDSRNRTPLKVVLTGSSAMLLQRGSEESLMGRFELLHCPHWSFAECRTAFGFSLDDYLYFGGYPGAAPLISDEDRWSRYIGAAIVEPTIAQDVLSMDEVRKPALLRALFNLGAHYSAQELSYTKLQGQLQDAGNTTTLAHYLQLLDKAGMLTGLQKYSASLLTVRNSSPRLLVHNTALMTYAAGSRREQLHADPTERGHLVESAVGAHLLARGLVDGFNVYWWRERSNEVDFVISDGYRLTAIEVKSGRVKGLQGIAAFESEYPHALSLVVGSPQLSLEDFLLDQTPLFKA
jgi:predicted AAA+ superfamily ATPase